MSTSVEGMTSLDAACDRIEKLEKALRRLQQLGSQVEILPDSDYVRDFDEALRDARALLS